MLWKTETDGTSSRGLGKHKNSPYKIHSVYSLLHIPLPGFAQVLKPRAEFHSVWICPALLRQMEIASVASFGLAERLVSGLISLNKTSFQVSGIKDKEG
jgi:hypothetical protein